MSEATGSKKIRTLIDKEEILIFGKIRHRDRVRAETVNQSLEVLNNLFLGDYPWQITHIDMFALNGDSLWVINAEAESDYSLADFDPDNIHSLTHFVEEDRLKLKTDLTPDDAMAQTENRAILDAKQEVASKTRFDTDDMMVTHTSVVHKRDVDTDAIRTRLRVDT